ncbi:hypothetical protein [Patulibacter defluvii]|uniref:hypothetical protein n=1 Tax=Patulibacter defluvii TaxID=3095358 RepID=UPI002A7654E5|nr:hypothetical protein [Patulibacter sp. DM4]
MRRILRDTWSWRGGLALDELEYQPQPADARDGPISEPAARHWPLLISSVDTVALLHADDRPSATIAGVAGLHMLLIERTGGYHAILPRRMPEVERRYDELCAGEPMVGFEEALEAMEEVGAVERSGSRIVVLRPPSPTPEVLELARARMDEAEERPEMWQVARRLQRLAWRTGAEGFGGQRFRQLARFGRLRATIADPDPGFVDRDGLYEVGPAALPPLSTALNVAEDGPHGVRGWVTAHDLRFETPPGEGSPILLAGYEAAALLLGGGVGTNALRRASRATGLWLQLLDHSGGRASAFDTTVAALAGGFAPLLELAPGDHRSTVTGLLADLERAGLIACERPSRKTLRVSVLPAAAPDDERTTSFLRQWSAWRMSGGASAAGLDGVVRLAGEHLRDRVRRTWVDLLETRRIRVEVLPPAP